MTQGIQTVLDHFQSILDADGGKLELLGVTDGVMKLSYQPGVNENCESCVLTPEDLKELVEEAAKRHDPSIRCVELNTVQ